MTPYFLLLLAAAAAAAAPDNAAPSSPEIAASFRPSVAIIVGIFVVMFTLTFLLLIYAKFCHASAAELFGPGMYPAGGGGGDPDAAAASRYSGVDKTVIESLPFFRFSSLRGSREGLECAVCLSRFEDAEILRLLPRCKHAFHISCVDRWLEAHSSCPLCRRKVDGDGAASLSSISRDPSSRRVDTELFVEREPSGRHGSSSRFGSFREQKNRDEVVLLAEEDGDGGQAPPPHRFKHRIIVSNVAFRSRWSDVNPSDIMSLRSDMLRAESSRRLEYRSSTETTPAGATIGGGEKVLEIREEMEKKRALESKARWMAGSIPVDPGEHVGSGASVAFGDRCMSEMTNVSRYRAVRESSGSSEDEKVRRVWLPIVRRTVRWLAGKERRPPPPPPP